MRGARAKGGMSQGIGDICPQEFNNVVTEMSPRRPITELDFTANITRRAVLYGIEVIYVSFSESSHCGGKLCWSYFVDEENKTYRDPIAYPK